MGLKVLLVLYFSIPVIICDPTDFNGIKATKLQIYLPKDYAKEIAPSVYNIKNREVVIDPSIFEIGDLDVIGNTIAYRIWIDITWVDTRILVRKDLINTTGWNKLDLRIKDHIWIPDLFI